MAQNLRKTTAVKFSVEPLELHCEWEDCAVVKNEIESFISHISNEHIVGLSGDDFHCHWKDCEGFTENVSELRRHILLHAFHAKLKCHGSNLITRKKLPDCSASLQTRNIIPELPEPLVCGWEECFYVYECAEHYYRHVDTHVKYDSKKNGTFMCFWQDCSRSFGTAPKVREHLRSHTQEKMVACPTCGAMLASRTKLVDHLHRQLSENETEKPGPYGCQYCSKKMPTERLLRDHMRHHVNNYKCPFCDMTCPTPSAIASHVSYRHSQSKPLNCDICDYKSKTESDLRKHLESHSSVPTFTCPVENCGYSSRSKTCYNAHYRKQHELKDVKYSCHLCEKTFTRGNYLTKHLIKAHKFRWPSGHSRFRYVLNEEGLYKLQTVRYESLELSQEMMGDDIEEEEDIDNPDSDVPESVPESNTALEYSEESLETEFVNSRYANTPSDHRDGLECLESQSDTSMQDDPDISKSQCLQSDASMQDGQDIRKSESDASVLGDVIGSEYLQSPSDSSLQDGYDIASSRSSHQSHYDKSVHDIAVSRSTHQSQYGKSVHDIASSRSSHQSRFDKPVHDIASFQCLQSRSSVAERNNCNIGAPALYKTQVQDMTVQDMSNSRYQQQESILVQDIQEASTVRIQEGSILMDTNLYLTMNPSSVQLRIVDVRDGNSTNCQQLLEADLDKPLTAVQSIKTDSQGMVVFETVEIPTS